ncbi:hypothetical protein B0T14DRAFT_529188 [Immersiella caudata]|uniref:Sulphur transport domain-containing protein n=1 Tax=Immersiella caudata TaxID=314043 RepID=A0AA39U4L6_9PEZI|nr:hypothetical protein B0T14DRAFT_529188 [Immersiella caudata]
MSIASRPAGGSSFPAAGGLLIGLAQLVSLLLRGNAVGVSAAYEDVGECVWWPFYSPESESESGSGDGSKRPSLKTSSIAFAVGIVIGSRALAVLTPGLLHLSGVPDVPMLQGVLGGFTMVLGARVAGGCTSGHGITGMSLLSISSFVTIGSALATGVLTASLVW